MFEGISYACSAEKNADSGTFLVKQMTVKTQWLSKSFRWYKSYCGFKILKKKTNNI